MVEGHLTSGKGHVFRGSRDLGIFEYVVYGSMNGQATLVRFDRPPFGRDGTVLHVALEDGRFLLCQTLDHSSFCAVVGEGPRPDRRRKSRPLSARSHDSHHSM